MVTEQFWAQEDGGAQAGMGRSVWAEGRGCGHEAATGLVDCKQ